MVPMGPDLDPYAKIEARITLIDHCGRIGPGDGNTAEYRAKSGSLHPARAGIYRSRTSTSTAGPFAPQTRGYLVHPHDEVFHSQGWDEFRGAVPGLSRG